ncbi:anti-repressor SinI family protein [Ornithinibacillus sp. BX22]|uniref:Anti-repressor SinI family protein n=1 Tax=Ornithinibacillus hominis TaxID=2763055 RepID=A0A923L2L8_9BACI|nr:anti-repressor SinI family protein [Ornithinibacillus hominis]MBC5635342.1 anti-repressor SinI family protein [Ornithinibacillus hominis]
MSNHLDPEWVILILEAKKAGISIEEIQAFLNQDQQFYQKLADNEQQKIYK